MPKFSNYHRLYFNKTIATNATLCIDDPENYNYIKHVIRLKVGNFIRLFNEKDGEYLASIQNIDKNSINLNVEKHTRLPLNQASKITLALCLIKNDKLTFAINAATALGVTDIKLITSKNTQSYIPNYERLQKCILQAAEQSESLIIPKLHAMIDFENYIKSSQKHNIIFADESATNHDRAELDKAIKCDHDLELLIGPEGGFANHERESMIQNENFIALSLGDRVLKSEIAVISALSLINFFKNT